MIARQVAFIALSISVLSAVGLIGCFDEGEARTNPAVLPREVAFRPVAEMMVNRCGSLDCHGSKYRNMRLFGLGGARLDPNDRPDAPAITQAEVDRDYDAIVSVEPEVLRLVAAERGGSPDRLTLVRKARGAEAHKGGQRIFIGDDADVCLRSWLSGAVNEAACKAALPTP